MPGKLFLIPNTLGSTDPNTFLPSSIITQITSLNFLIVENIRNARRYLKMLDAGVNIDDITFFELNKHTDDKEIGSFLKPILEGYDCGVISEAGLPGIADPGAAIVRIAHKKNIEVVPFIGPSSIFLALMASGLNGQSFRFAGYLPIKTNERIQAIRLLEKRAVVENETQIFIETPYRNNALFDDIMIACNEMTMLTLAVDISTESEVIKTQPVGTWKKKKPELHKRPAVFLLGRS